MKEETKLKISKSSKGKKKPKGFGAKIAEINRHRIFSKETRLKMSLRQIGRIIPEKQKKKHSQFMINKFKDHKFKKKMLAILSPFHQGGKKHWNWKGGISFTKEYRAKQYLLSHRKRKNIKLRVGGFHTEEQWEELKKKYNYMCLCCKKYEPKIKLSRDHIIPISKEGSDDISNIQPLCGKCNSKKHTKTIKYEI